MVGDVNINVSLHFFFQIPVNIVLSAQNNTLLSDHRICISRLKTDSFFFFLHDPVVLQLCPIKSVEYAWSQKTSQQEQTFFFNAILFFSARLLLIY